jgi:hypothetical protein
MCAAEICEESDPCPFANFLFIKQHMMTMRRDMLLRGVWHSVKTPVNLLVSLGSSLRAATIQELAVPTLRTCNN